MVFVLNGIKSFSDEANLELLRFYELANSLAPQLFKGFDFVGYEDSDSLAKFSGLVDTHFKYKTPPLLVFHAGESGLKSNENCRVALEEGSVRLGHGLMLVDDEETLVKVKDRGILVEANPVSNWVLGYVLDLRWHPLRFLVNRGVKVR